MPDPNQLLAAIQAFLQVSNEKEFKAVFQQYPELLDEEIDPVFTAIIENAREQGEAKIAQALEQRYQMLQAIRNANPFQTTIQQAEAAQQRYFNRDDVGGLDEAIVLWEKVLQHRNFATADTDFRLAVINDSAGTYLQRYLARGNLSDLSTAISAWETAIAETPSNSLDLPGRLSNLGEGLRKRYLCLGSLADLQTSITVFRQAVATTPSNSPDLPMYLNNLGNGLTDRYSHLGNLADLQAGIEAYQQSVATTPSNSPSLPRHLTNLGVGLTDRYSRLGNLADLQAGINAYQQAIVATTPSNSTVLPNILNNLGTGLWTRYSRLGDLKDLQASIDTYQQAVDKTPPDSPGLPSYLTNLGTGLIDRYFCLGDLADLQKGTTVLQQAVAKTPPDSPDLPSRLNNLGHGLRKCYSRLGNLANLQASIIAIQQAVDKTSFNSPDLPMYLNNLGNVLTERYSRLGNLADLQAGITAYQQAMQHGSDVLPQEGLNAASNWLNLAFDRSSWSEIEQAYPTLKEISDRLVETQLIREHQESFLEDTQGLVAKVAYARIQTGDLPKAAEALEQGVARLLSMALMLLRTDLTQLQQDAPELASAYKAHLIDWQNAQRTYHHVAPQYQAEAYQRLQTANQALDDVKQRIRQLKGHENFLSVATDLQTIYQAAETHPLVYLFVTEKGSYALVVFQNNIQEIVLSELTDETFTQKINSYFEVYSKRKQNLEIWYQAIEDIGKWLWKVIWHPLLNILPKYSAITLIPVGWLNLLPLHAAWTPDSTRPTGKRYALDDFTINYAPNALSLQKAKERATIAANKLLAIDEPKPVFASELPSSHVEVNAIIIGKHFTKLLLFRHEQATVDAVKNALNSDYTVLHFSCHGGANLENPLETGLLMAMVKSPHNMLTVQDFFDAQLKARLVTLSACETGMIGTKQVEEVVSLSTSLLQAGVAGVASSLWSVSDAGTALLMIQFYQRWRNHYPDNPAEALRQAQQWVRDSKPREKTAFLRTILPEEEAKKLREKMGFDDYTRPYYWAAFTYVGV